VRGRHYIRVKTTVRALLDNFKRDFSPLTRELFESDIQENMYRPDGCPSHPKQSPKAARPDQTIKISYIHEFTKRCRSKGQLVWIA